MSTPLEQRVERLEQTTPARRCSHPYHFHGGYIALTVGDEEPSRCPGCGETAYRVMVGLRQPGETEAAAWARI